MTQTNLNSGLIEKANRPTDRPSLQRMHTHHRLNELLKKKQTHSYYAMH
jgi:hypothetical protein